MLKMGLLLPFLVASTLLQLLLCEVPHGIPFKATIHQVEGNNRIFSGESARFNCSVTGGSGFSWRILWFKGDEYLQQTEELSLWNAKIQQSGKYCCQGVRDTAVGSIHTLKSRPIEMHVDGGWAILQVPPHPPLVGNTLTMTCRVRGKPPPKLAQVILYRDGVEVLRQRGSSPDLHIPRVTVKDRGLYTCRATWNSHRYSHSTESVAIEVSVLEILEEPTLEVVPNNGLIPANLMKLICHVQYNAPASAPPLVYYFYKNGHRHTPAASQNQVMVPRASGVYHCKAKVPLLGLERLSQTKVAGLEHGQAPPVFQLSTPAFIPLKPRAEHDHVETIVKPTDPPSTQGRHQPVSDIPLPATIPHISDETVQLNIQTTTLELLDMSGDCPDSLEPITDLP